MTPIEIFLQTLIQIGVWDWVKLLVLFGLGLYIIFAFIIVREVDLMNRTLNGIFNLPIKVASLIHLIFSVLVFILGLIIL